MEQRSWTCPVPKRVSRMRTSRGRRKEPRRNSETEARPHEACTGSTDHISRGLPVPRDRRLCLVAQSCTTLCDPVNCSPPGSSVHGIFQARDLPDPGIKHSLILLTLVRWQADSLPSVLSGKPEIEANVNAQGPPRTPARVQVSVPGATSAPRTNF